MGNLRSVAQALKRVGATPRLVSSSAEFADAEALVLPGVGAFGDGCSGLAERGLVEPLREAARSGKPLLGICLGLQLLFAESEEAPGAAGLGLLPGKVMRFRGARFGAQGGLKVPHMGWNRLSFPRPHPLFANLPGEAWVYFVHSYYPVPADEETVLAESEYGMRFCAAAGRGNVWGCQFHPEKSQRVGLRILENFLGLARERRTAGRST
jgi:glutamine amidotransferase